jgi:hypothetical protein
VHDRPRASDFQSPFFSVCWLFSLLVKDRYGEPERGGVNGSR